MTTLVIGPVERTSATLADSMRECMLRAALGRSKAADELILGRPAAWLGNIYHSVMEEMPQTNLSEETAEEAFTRIWERELEQQLIKNKSHPLNCRYLVPENWPKFEMIRAMAEIRTVELVREPEVVGGSSSNPNRGDVTPFREQWMTALSGKIGGKPDLVTKDRITDYKSGQIYEFDGNGDSARLKMSYIRQLRIYGYLVEENLGYLPKVGVVMAVDGSAEQIELNRIDCAREAEAAVDLMNKFNAALVTDQDARDLASPSVASCKWCPYQLLCTRFWEEANEKWFDDMWEVAAAGKLISDPISVHNGQAYSIHVEVDSGVVSKGPTTINPLLESRYPDLRRFSAGQRIRLTGLKKYQDGTIRPSDRTVAAIEDELPVVEVQSSSMFR